MQGAFPLPVDQLRPGLFRPVRRDPAGVRGPTPKVARGPGWRRSSRGRYVPASVELSVDQRILEAASVLPGHGGVTGWAGLAWLGGRWFDGRGAGGRPRPVTMVVAGDHVRPQPGIALSHERLDPRDLLRVDGIRVTVAVRSAWFEMRYARDARAAAVVLSMAAYSDLVSIEELAEFSYEHPGWTGAPRCRSGTALAYENCWSPPEVEVAMTWHVDAGLPRLRCNEPIFDRSGRHLATPDFLDVESGLVMEFNGPHHFSPRQRARDVAREEMLRAHGLAYLEVLGAHLGDRWTLVSRMQTARRHARFEAESARSWTAEPPAWWIPTHTVALRRSLTGADRARLLGYRQAA